MLRFHVAVLAAALLSVALDAQDPAPVPPSPDTPVVERPQPKPDEPVPDAPPAKPAADGAQPKAEAPKAEAPNAESKPAAAPKVDPKAGTDQQPGDKPPAEPETETKVDLPADTPLPKGGDPADLKAMRSAQAMVSAERRMRSAIKSGKVKDVDKLLAFEEISSWPYQDGLEGLPKPVAELDDKEVLMIGFMLPIDEVEDIHEFLLVQSLWACCYGSPPDINGIVRVVMKGDKRVDYQFEPIQVRGTFKVKATTEDGYTIDIYQLHASSVSLVK